MIVIRSRNVHDALPEGLRLLREIGVQRETRNGPALVAPEPVTTVYAEPAERVLFWATRDANPFFHFMEGLWMLGGRDDVRFVAHFAQNIAKYSDDGLRLNGAYGYRWRKYFGYDQLAEIAERLKKNKQDRQCVVAMWAGDADLRAETLDRPCNISIVFSCARNEQELDMTVYNRSNDSIWGCLSGDTDVLSPEGPKKLSVLAASDLGEKPFPVYAVDPETGDMSIKNCIRAWSTGTKPIIELVFDNGSTLKLTSDHRLYKKMTRRGVTSTPENSIIEVTAGEIKVGDRIWAPAPWLVGNRRRFKRNILGNTGYSNVQLVARSYEEFLRGPIPRGWHVHHKNEDPSDDRRENLQRMPAKRHMSIHMKHKMAKLSEEQRAALAKKGSNSAKVALQNMSDEEKEKRRTALAHQAKLVFTNYHASLSSEERSARARRASEAARLVNTKEQLRERQKRAVLSRLAKKDHQENHVVVEIRKLPPEETFDFTVEDYHTALVGDGVLVHNCYGANAVHMSMLQEYMAGLIGVGVGKYWQVSNNYHAYLDTYQKCQDLSNTADYLPETRASLNPYVTEEVSPYPMMSEEPRVWDQDLTIFLEQGPIVGFRDRFFRRVATPIFHSWSAWKAKDLIGALEIIEQCAAKDWKKACREWLLRRVKP